LREGAHHHFNTFVAAGQSVTSTTPPSQDSQDASSLLGKLDGSALSFKSLEIPCIVQPMNNTRLNEELIDCLFAIRIQIHTELKELARDAGLTDTQTDVLWRLSREAEMTARRLAELLQCDASTATSMIDRLEKRGLVRRIPHPSDRRAKLIQLTPAGCELRDRVIRHTSAHSPFARLDRPRRLQLHALLRDVIDGTTTEGETSPGSNNHAKGPR